MEQIDLYWVQDSGGTWSCHVNNGKNFVESLIGTLRYRNDTWHVILKDDREISPETGLSFARAMQLMESFYREDLRGKHVEAPQATKVVTQVTGSRIEPVVATRHKPREAQAGKV